MHPMVGVEGFLGVKYETADYKEQVINELGKQTSKEPRMFSLNQIRELIYLHLHRSELL